MKRFCLGAVCALLACGPSWSQQPVFTWPQAGSTAGGNASSSVAVTNTFQLVFGSSPQQPGAAVRKGCTIINYGTNTMWVTEGLGVAGSTKAKAVQLAANQAFYCQVYGIVLTGEIDLTGTSGDAFYAAQY